MRLKPHEAQSYRKKALWVSWVSIVVTMILAIAAFSEYPAPRLQSIMDPQMIHTDMCCHISCFQDELFILLGLCDAVLKDKFRVVSDFFILHCRVYNIYLSIYTLSILYIYIQFIYTFFPGYTEPSNSQLCCLVQCHKLDTQDRV